MRKIKGVLRLKYAVGLGLRQIARSCSIGVGTAHEYVQRAKIGMTSGWRRLCSAVRHGRARRYVRCPILPSCTGSGSCIAS